MSTMIVIFCTTTTNYCECRSCVLHSDWTA